MMRINKTTTSFLLAGVCAALAVPNALAQTGTEQSDDIVADVARERATNFLNQDSLSLTADIELDFDYNNLEDAPSDERNFDAGGRVRLTLSGSHTAGSRFIKGRADLLLKEDGDASTDDAWLSIGDALWEVQLGRFEAINLFPLGLDTIVLNADGVSVYENNLARGRVGGSGGQVALRLRPNDLFSAEVAMVWGDPQEGNNEGIGGVRPAVTFRANENFAFTIGGEWVEYESNDLSTDVNSRSIGGTVNYSGSGVLVNVNAAYQDRDDSIVDANVLTLGANFIYTAAQNKFGAGVIYSNEDPQDGDDEDLWTVYGAYVVPLFFERAAISFGASYSSSSADVENDDVLALRTRFNYAF